MKRRTVLMLDNIAYIAAAILFPVLPAYVLYKALPARTSVKGPFKGLNIQLSGAFGGYFLLVLAVLSFVQLVLIPRRSAAVLSAEIENLQNQIKNLQTTLNSNYEVYRVEGQVETTGMSVKPRIAIVPPKETLDNGTFNELLVPVSRGQHGELVFPRLQVTHPDYETDGNSILDLNDPPGPGFKRYTIRRDDMAKTLSVEDTIKLSPKTP